MKRPTNPMLMDFQITEDHILKGILQTARSRRQIKDNQVISSMWPDCLDCVEAAATKITKACKFWKEGIVWFEECTLRYANRTIFSIDEEDPYKLYYNDTGIVTEHQLDQYKQVFDTTMDALINQAAYSQGTLPGFATKQINLSTSGILEGLAQCTPDIVGRPCYRCLRTALRLRDTWANTVVFLPSCLIRYDLYETVLLSPPSQPPPPQQGLHIGIIVAVIIVVVLLIVLALIGGWFLLYKPRPQGDEDSVSGLQRLTSAQVKKMTRNFTKVLGEGACGVVYRGKLLGSSKKVAIKLLNKLDDLTQFNNEIDVLRMVRHSNVVSLLGYCQDPKTLALVCEYMDKGDLKDRLSGSCSLSWRQRLQIAIDTATGLAYLHDNCDYPIVHRDVKPANILLHEIDGELTAKVADFGYSKIFPAKDVTTLQTRIIGTCGYIAPEYSLNGLLNNKIDVYSFGVVLIQLITGKAPRREDNGVKSFQEGLETKDIENILDSKVGRDVGHASVWKAAEVANSCVNNEPNKRPNMSQIVSDLTQSLDMELRKNEVSSRTSSSPMFISNPLYLGSISEVPELQQISDSDNPKGKKKLGTESPIAPPEARKNSGNFCIGSTSKASSPVTLDTNSEDREGYPGSCGDGSSSRYITCLIVSDIVQEVPEEEAAQ